MLRDSSKIIPLQSLKSAHLLNQYLLTAILACGVFVIVTHAWHLSLSTPFSYWGDAVVNGALIKSIIESGWYTSNAYIGAPGGYNMIDYPMGVDNFHFAIIKLLSYFTSNFAVILNVFYILTFPTVAISALFVLRRLGLRYAYALAGSLLFTALPYHFYRGEWHLFLSSYYIVPLSIWIAISIGKGNFKIRRNDWKQLGIYGLLCILIGSSGLYYGLFSVFFILCAGLFAAVNIKKMLPVWQALILSGFIFATVIINVSPTWIYHMHYGSNNQAVLRSANESEFYGLKIVQMLLPVDNDRVPFMAKLKNEYLNSAPLNNENNDASLGIIGSIGLCTLLVIVLFGFRISKEIDLVSKLNLCGLLVSTVGGFGTLFAYTVSPSIRCYNRISIFIAFFSLYTFFYFLQRFTSKYDFFKKSIIHMVFLLLIVGVGLFNQSSNTFVLSKNSGPLVANFSDDENFVHQIESTMPQGSMIYQLPYIAFPEHGTLVNMLDYNHFRAYLHSKALKWSYGAMKNRPVAIWQEKISALPLNRMLDNLIYAGYTGLYIDRSGYEDHGLKIETTLSSLLHLKPLVSHGGNLSFFDLLAYKDHLKQLQPLSLWLKNVQKIRDQQSVSFSMDGCYNLEKTNGVSSQWCKKKSILRFVNESNKTISVKIAFKVLTNEAEFSKLILKGVTLNREVDVNHQGVDFTPTLNLPPGKFNLYLDSKAKKVDAPGDPRELYFRIANIKWQVLS